ncbi:MAG: hypothetical protein ABJH96_00210 [Algoriphagus sp.]|uniref:hypothetical protein n=1 Tax=Algoriphagus sp. TaxID=1872435 RepID=UPI003299EAA4
MTDENESEFFDKVAEENCAKFSSIPNIFLGMNLHSKNNRLLLYHNKPQGQISKEKKSL